jgi:branched-chain amino acid transport system permease protein
VVQALAIVIMGSGFKNIAALSILLLFLFFRPNGLLGSAK